MLTEKRRGELKLNEKLARANFLFPKIARRRQVLIYSISYSYVRSVVGSVHLLQRGKKSRSLSWLRGRVLPVGVHELLSVREALFLSQMGRICECGPFSFRHDRRFPKLGARLYAMVNLVISISYPALLCKSANGVSLGGSAMVVFQRCCIFVDGGFSVWNGRCRKSCERCVGVLWVLMWAL